VGGRISLKTSDVLFVVRRVCEENPTKRVHSNRKTHGSGTGDLKKKETPSGYTVGIGVVSTGPPKEGERHGQHQTPRTGGKKTRDERGERV